MFCTPESIIPEVHVEEALSVWQNIPDWTWWTELGVDKCVRKTNIFSEVRLLG